MLLPLLWVIILQVLPLAEQEGGDGEGKGTTDRGGGNRQERLQSEAPLKPYDRNKEGTDHWKREDEGMLFAGEE